MRGTPMTARLTTVLLACALASPAWSDPPKVPLFGGTRRPQQPRPPTRPAARRRTGDRRRPGRNAAAGRRDGGARRRPRVAAAAPGRDADHHRRHSRRHERTVGGSRHERAAGSRPRLRPSR